MRLMFFLLLLGAGMVSASEKEILTATWAEQYIKQNHPSLMLGSESDHVMSVYYFGRFNNRSLMGLERVRGENYEQFFTLLIFEDDHLLGFYKNVLSFPSTLNKEGEVNFPYGISGNLKTSGNLLTIGAKEFGDLCQTQAQITQCYAWQPATYKSLK